MVNKSTLPQWTSPPYWSRVPGGALTDIAVVLVCIVVALAPLPFGSAEPFWGAIWCVFLAAAVLIARPTATDSRLNPAFLLLLTLIVAWCIVVALQYLPAETVLPAGPGWAETRRILGDQAVVPKVAVYAQIPIAAVVPPLALVLALLAGLIIGRDPSCVPRLYAWAATAGLAYACYGIFAEVTDPNMLLWHEKTAYVDAVTGTFVNHNTAATYFGSIAIIWYLRTLREIRRQFDLSRWRDLEYVLVKLKNLDRALIVYGLAFLVMLAATFMTRSRAGSLLTMAVLGVVTVLYLWQEFRSVRHAALGGLTLVAAGALALELAGGQLATQIENRGVYDAGRAQAWLSAAGIIHDHPWLGTGLGTFVSIFSSYRNPAGGIWGIWNYAHSTPLELMVEMGVPFALLVCGGWILMLVVLFRATIVGAAMRFYVVAGAGICLLGSLHTLVDFSLQIPGYSMICCLLSGASLASALSPVDEASLQSLTQPSSRPETGGSSRTGLAESHGGGRPADQNPVRAKNAPDRTGLRGY